MVINTCDYFYYSSRSIDNCWMKIIDIQNKNRINRKPDKISIILSSGTFFEQEFLIKKVELRLYKERTDKKLGLYSLITSSIETDKGYIEMIYDEGFLGDNPIEQASELLTKNLGISGLVLRSIISLREELKKISNKSSV